MPLGTKKSQASDEHTLNFGLKIRSGPKGPGFGAPKSTLTGNQCTHDEPSGKSFVVFSCFFLGGVFDQLPISDSTKRQLRRLKVLPKAREGTIFLRGER